MKKNIVIIILLFIVAILLAITIIRKGKSEIVKYSYFDDDLIQVDNQSSFEVKSNIVDNENLLIYVSSNYDKSILAVAEVIFRDEDGETIASDSSSLVVLNHSGQVFTFYLPSLVGEYAGNIDIVIKEQETNQQIDFSLSDIKLEESHTITEEMNTNFTIQIQNNSNFLIQSFTGMMVGLKDDKIVATTSFSSENLLANSSNTVNAMFYFYTVNHETKVRDYDELLMFPTYIEIV